MHEIFIDQIQEWQIDLDYIDKISQNWSINVSFLFKCDFKNAKYLRDYLILILDYFWFQPIWKSRFTLIADELNNNSIEHWSKDWDINIMRLKVEKLDDSFFINLEVEDSWNWKNSKNSKEMDELRINKLEKWFQDHKSIRWRWLFMIIVKLVDELYFKDSSNWWLIVWVNKKIPF